MTTTEVDCPAETASLRLIREPQPPCEQNGEAGKTTNSSSDASSATERKSRPVTAATAYRRKLWRQGTLIYEDEWGAYEITEIFEDLTAHTELSEPGLQRQSFAFRPEQMLMFAPSSGASNAGASSSDGEGDQDYLPFDEVDTKHALWHVRSALEDAECIRGRPILKMGITRDLRCAKRILSEHAERNGFDV